MLEVIRPAVIEARSLDDVRDSMFLVFKEIRAKGYSRIGYVSGIIGSDGHEDIARNLE